MNGYLAKKYCNLNLEVEVLESRAGFYLGTESRMGPVSRESEEYYRTQEEAQEALKKGTWTQRTHP